MREFSFYVQTGDVRKQRPDHNLADATAKESQDRLALARAIAKTQKPKYVVENAYEAIRELIDAVLYETGYKSYSHEASVVYLLTLGFTLVEVTRVDQLRKHRNGIKYYGEDATPEEARNALKIAQETIEKLRKKLPR